MTTGPGGDRVQCSRCRLAGGLYFDAWCEDWSCVYCGHHQGAGPGRPPVLRDQPAGHSPGTGRPLRSSRVREALPAIIHAIHSRAGEKRLVDNVAREFGVSRTWLYTHVMPSLGCRN